MQTPSKASALERGELDPDEIRRLVQLGKARGLIRAPGKVALDKQAGVPVSNEGGLCSQWMDVDPGLAAQWLQNNFGNRPLSEPTVAAYARDMKNGVWVATHQGIAFNDRDELIDGQHRLHAIVRSGCTVKMMVTYGLPSKIEGKEMTTMDAVDRGRPRSVADQLKIQHGFPQGALHAAICAALGGLCYGERTRRLSVGQTLEIFRAFEPSIKFVIDNRSTQQGLKSAGFMAAFAFALQPLEPRKAKAGMDMFRRIVAGERLVDGMPITQLREFLVSDEAKLLNRGSDRGVAELTLQALCLEFIGEPVEQLEMSLDGRDYFRGLQPERVEFVAGLFRLPG